MAPECRAAAIVAAAPGKIGDDSDFKKQVLCPQICEVMYPLNFWHRLRGYRTLADVLNGIVFQDGIRIVPAHPLTMQSVGV